jgi:hypothetical protein
VVQVYDIEALANFGGQALAKFAGSCEAPEKASVLDQVVEVRGQ